MNEKVLERLNILNELYDIKAFISDKYGCRYKIKIKRIEMGIE